MGEKEKKKKTVSRFCDVKNIGTHFCMWANFQIPGGCFAIQEWSSLIACDLSSSVWNVLDVLTWSKVLVKKPVWIWMSENIRLVKPKSGMPEIFSIL